MARKSTSSVFRPRSSRVLAHKVLVGDQFVMNGQSPALVIDANTVFSGRSRVGTTVLTMKMANGGILVKELESNHRVMIRETKNSRMARRAESRIPARERFMYV